MKRKIVYIMGIPRFESVFTTLLNYALLLVRQTVKMASSVAEGISVRCLKHRHMPE